MFGQPTRPDLVPFCFYEKAFTPEECEHIISCGLLLPKDSGTVINGKTQEVKNKQRLSEVSWIEWNPNIDWVFQKLERIVASANQARFGYALSGFGEPLQFTQYLGPGHHYDWHKDLGSGQYSIRKLSITVQLSDESKYAGGDLEFFGSDTATPRSRGTVVVFPSYEVHRVTPIKSGTRYSLVGWVSGPPFA
jgi:PKHD-type hydroxylase